MKNKIFENIPLKVISLVVAFIVWLIVINIVKPVVIDSVNVPVAVINEDVVRKMNKTYLIKDQHVCKVSYKINQEQLNAVRQTDFKVYVDLNDIFDTTELPVYCETLNDINKFISDVEVEPKTLHVVLDDAIWNEYPIKYNINGHLGKGRSIGSVVISPNILYVSGTRENIQKIASVSVDIPVDENAESFSGEASIHLYDENKKEINNKDFELSAKEAGYLVTIVAQRGVNINAAVEGEVRRGYTYEGLEINPNVLEIVGLKSVVENLYSIDLPIININDLTEDTEYVFAVKNLLPVGVNCLTTEIVSVKVKINKNVINSPKESVGPNISEDIKESIVEGIEE